MKTRATSAQAHGHVMIMVLLACLLLGLVLLGVISLTTNDGHMTARSQSWNGAIPIAEAGIEEAFTHLKYCPTNRASNGWTLAATGDYYTNNRTIGSAWYGVTISTNYDPIIISRGGIRAPGQANYIIRTVRVTATNEPMFSAAIEATDGIFFNGGTVTINSYDSRELYFYRPDLRYDTTKFNDRGRVVCHYGPFDMGNGKIYGRVETGEDSALEVGATGVVGNKNWHDTGQRGVQPGWHTSTTSSEFSEIPVPTGGETLPTRVANTTLFTNANRIYATGNLPLQGSIVVQATNVTIIVNSAFNADDFIVERGASLKLFVYADSVKLSGVNNKNISAHSFMYYGLPSNKFISLTGNGGFCGILFAPDAALDIKGGGSNDEDFMGSIIARMVTVNGSMTFHFDEAAMSLGSRGFIANRWDEL